MQLRLVDWAVFLLLPVLAWLVAVRGKAKAGLGGTYRGYFLASGKLGTTSTAATYIGANLTLTSIFIILSEEGAKRGWWVLAVPVFWIVGTIVFVASYPRLAPHITAGRTLHQTLGHVFNSPTIQRWASFWTIVAFVSTVALEFWGGIRLVSWAQVPLVTSVTIVMVLAFAVSAFTTSGGLRGVATADILLDVASLIAAVCIARGALSAWPTASAPLDHPPLAPEWLFVASMAVLFVPFQFCTLDSWQRLLAWRGRASSPRSWLLGAGVGLAVVYCIPIAAGVAARSSQSASGLHPLEFAIRTANLPPLLLGLCFAGLAGAMLSTADELLNCASLSLIADYWRVPFSDAHSNVNNQLLFAKGQFYTAVFSFIAAILALLAVRFNRAVADLAYAVFSAQIVFVWPLWAALTTPQLAPGLRRWAISAMAVGGVVAPVVVAIGWSLSDTELSAAAPVAAFVFAGLTFAPAWLWSLWKARRGDEA